MARAVMALDAPNSGVECSGNGGVGTPSVALANQTEKGSDMVQDSMPSRVDDGKPSSPEAAAYRIAWLKMMGSMAQWVVSSSPEPDVILAEMERTTSMMRQIQASGRVMPQ